MSSEKIYHRPPLLPSLKNPKRGPALLCRDMTVYLFINNQQKQYRFYPEI